MSASPPLRFLAVVLGGWAVLRTAVIAPPWSTPPADAAAAASRSRNPPAPRRGSKAPEARGSTIAPAARQATYAVAIQLAADRSGLRIGAAARAPLHVTAPNTLPPRPILVQPAAAPLAPPAAFPPPPGPAAPSPRRWSVSAWTFVRQGDSPALAAGGVLGGSQAGARFAYRLNRDAGRPLALSVRLSAPIRHPAGAEAALGIDWKPSRRVPVRVLAERRQALGEDGRSAFAVTLYGGVSEARLGPLRADAYAQAGIVGARSRDPFADGSLRLSVPLGGRARLGAGAWAAAQPGVARMDLGPQAALRLPVAGRSVTVAADWRVRVAGNARPGSGPTLTVATDF
ncbi:MAG TPA: hypothetical protein VF548_05165 [Allosphingosinicella sp.]|jgi:hypothetical protein